VGRRLPQLLHRLYKGSSACPYMFAPACIQSTSICSDQFSTSCTKIASRAAYTCNLQQQFEFTA
jgi:hypothetical protein